MKREFYGLSAAMALASLASAGPVLTRQAPDNSGERRAQGVPPESNGRRDFPAAFLPSSYDAATHEVELTLATGAAVRRRWIVEELDMSPEAIDLSRAALNQLRLLFNHNQDDPIGSLFNVRLENGVLAARARFADTERAREIERQVASGDLPGVSIGYQVKTWALVAFDEESDLETWRATSWELFEGSIVPVPADPRAGVRSLLQVSSGDPGDPAASNEDEDMLKRNHPGAESAAPAPAASAPAAPGVQIVPALEPRGLTATEVLDGMAMARSVGLDPADLEDSFRSPTQTVSGLNAEILRAAAARQSSTTVAAGAGARALTDEREVAGRGMVDALVSRMTHTAPTEHGAKYRGYTLADLIAERAGITGRHSVHEILQRAMHTSSDFPKLLEAASGKVLMDAYTLAAPTYRQLAARRSFGDFKPHKFLRIGEFPDLVPIGESGEVQAGTLFESRETVTLGTKGRKITLSRQMLINDDLSAFSDLTGAAGRAAARGENAAFWSLVSSNVALADGVAMFHADHDNLGTGGAMSVTTLGEGRALMRKQTDVSGLNALNTVARFLVTSPDYETDAEKLTFSVQPNQTSAVNPFSGRLTPLSDAELEGAAWYMFADPAACPNFIYGYLGSAEGPMITQDTPFGVDGVSMQVLHDFAVGAVDHRGAVKNAGA